MFIFSPPVVVNCNVAGNLRVCIRSRGNNSVDALCSRAGRFVTTLGGHPRVRDTTAAFSAHFPRCLIRISTTHYGHTNVSPSSMLSILSYCINNGCTSGVGHFSGVCHIVMRTGPRCELGGRSLSGVCIHSSSKDVTPIKRFIALSGACNPRVLDQFGLFDAVSIGTAPTRKCDSNSTVRTIHRITGGALPTKCKCRFKNASHRRTSSNASFIIVFIVYILFVCVVLYSLCRDLFIPLTMVLSVPFKLVNDFLFTGVFNMRGGMCVRAKLVVLVKLLTGATVLIARCTSRHHHRNVAVIRTTLSTTTIQLHPVLVATLAVVVNLFPLMVTANTNTGNGVSLNINAMNNVLVKAITLLFIIPILFVIFRAVRREMVPGQQRERRRVEARPLLRRGGWLGEEGCRLWASGVFPTNLIIIL